MDFSEKQKKILIKYKESLVFGFSVMSKVQLRMDKMRLKKQLLYLHMGAIHSFSEAILRLIETRPIYDKAAEVLMRSLIELYINLSFILAGKNQRNAFIFVVDSIQDRLDFAQKHKTFWKSHPQWNMAFGDKILQYFDWDVFIKSKEKELKKMSRKYKFAIPKKIPDIRSRAVIFDNYLKSINKLKEHRSMEKNYILFYKYFSQIAHLSISGIDRFVISDSSGALHFNVDGKPEDIERIALVTHAWYVGLLKVFSKEFKVYNKSDFKKLIMDKALIQ